MMRSCGCNKGQEYNGWGKAILTRNTFVVAPQSEEERIQLLGYGMMKVLGVKVRRA